MIKVYIDGACEPINPNGIATYGVVIYKNGQKILELNGVIGRGKGMSNNVAEYVALIKALEYLFEDRKEEIQIYSDSQLLINQMSGLWNANKGLYLKYYLEANQLKKLFKNINFIWIPRECNIEADELSKKAYEGYCVKHSLPIKYIRGSG